MSGELRTDIQALRGVAVLLVVLYHADFGVFAGGYLGVDIFFVISGFLITRLVADSIRRGDFRLSEFYFRRAKRLLPAAYVTFLATAVLAPFVLSQQDMNDLVGQMIGAITFTANIVLWQQAGYFERSAELKPLLHTWSLSIEEQYYLILPTTLLLVPCRYWRPGAIALVVSSLALCLVGSQLKPVATFYLLPTRAWELAIGSIGALTIGTKTAGNFSRWLFMPSLLVLAIIPAFPFRGDHPGIDAILACAATLAIILRNHPMLGQNFVARALARVGDISYSLYLVHWPVFALARSAWVVGDQKGLPSSVRVVAVLISFALAYLLYSYVEDPIRRARFRFSRRLLTGAIAASLGLMAITLGLARATVGEQDFTYVTRPNFGLDKVCLSDLHAFRRSECQRGDPPRMLIWGDSFAAHLVNGLSTFGGDRGVVQATRGACGPYLDYSVVERTLSLGRNEEWAKNCIAFNRAVLTYLRESEAIDLVVLSSTFDGIVNQTLFRTLFHDGFEYRVLDATKEKAVERLKATVAEIRRLGKRVVVVGPPPSGGFDIGSCLQRRLAGKVVFGVPYDCTIQLSEYQSGKAAVLELVGALPDQAEVEVVRLDSLLCDDKTCMTSIEGVGLYNDDMHLSVEGSLFIAERFDLLGRIEATAR